MLVDESSENVCACVFYCVRHRQHTFGFLADNGSIFSALP